jgi:hypothetical protein
MKQRRRYESKPEGWHKRAQAALGESGDDGDPLSGVVNLFDASMVLVVALILALAGSTSLGQVAARMSTEDITIVTNPGTPEMELIIKHGETIEHLRATDAQGAGRGERLGIAYRLQNGEVIYVPEGVASEQPD